MSTFPASLDNLIAYVRDLRTDGGPLDHLADAVLTAQELSDQSDALIGHFVDQARVSGASWSQIGAAMGVTKQAAQKRFVARDEPLLPEGKAFSRLTPRARISVAAAGQLASAAGADAVDVPHLAAGALVDPGSLASRAMRRLGVSDDQLHEALGVGAATACPDPDPGSLRELRYTQPCREAFQQALKTALRLGHNYIGTEHLLLAVAAGDGSVREALAALGLQPDLIESVVVVELAEARLQMHRRAGD